MNEGGRDTLPESSAETASGRPRNTRVKWTTQEWITSLLSVTALVISGIAGWYSYQSFYYQYKRVHHEVWATATGLDLGNANWGFPSFTTYTLKNTGNQNEVITLVFLGFSRHVGDRTLAVPLIAPAVDSEAVNRFPVILQPGEVEYGRIKHPQRISEAMPYHPGEPSRSDSVYVWLGVDAIEPGGSKVRTYLFHSLLIHPDSSVVEGRGLFQSRTANILEGRGLPMVNYVLPGGIRLPMPEGDSGH